MNRADFTTATNGFPLEADSTLGFMQETYTEALNALARLAGTSSVVVAGCVENGNQVGNGWIYYNGELLKFLGGTKQNTIIIEETVVQKGNADGTPYDRYFTRISKFGTGTNSITWSNFKRVGNLTTQLDLILKVAIEDNIILTGCEVPFNLPAGTTQIGSGTVIIGGKVMSVSSYNNSFPVWINESGEYVVSEPSGNSIKFDPFSDRRIEYVFTRLASHPGEIKILSTGFDFFGSNGIGQGPYSGWALCDGRNNTRDMRGLFPVGRDERTTDPSNGNWDQNYNTAGNTGGEKEMVLIADDNVTTGNVNPGEYGKVRATEQNRVDNRPPYMTLVFIQRIF